MSSCLTCRGTGRFCDACAAPVPQVCGDGWHCGRCGRLLCGSCFRSSAAHAACRAAERQASRDQQILDAITKIAWRIERCCDLAGPCDCIRCAGPSGDVERCHGCQQQGFLTDRSARLCNPCEQRAEVAAVRAGQAERRAPGRRGPCIPPPATIGEQLKLDFERKGERG